MKDAKRIREKIKSYRAIISMLEKRLERMKAELRRREESAEGIEEGEIVSDRRKSARKRKAEEKEKALEDSRDSKEFEKRAAKELPEMLRGFFSTVDAEDTAEQKSFLSKLLPFLDNSVKYVILHDVVLFSRSLEKFEAFLAVLYPGGLEKDGSEVSKAFGAIEKYVKGKISEEEIKAECIGVLSRAVGYSVMGGGKIALEAFDAGAAMRLYSKVLDWSWTYNEFIREHLFPELRKTDRPLPVYVLSLLYAEWNRSLVSHKSLEYVIQTLDKIVGIGSGENIISSPYCAESQLVSALMLRQFRPGALLKWHRKRIEESSGEEREKHEKLWSINIL